MKRCGLYVRVAAEAHPLSQDNPIENQVDALKAFVDQKDSTTGERWKVAQIYRDNGKSGLAADGPGYRRMLSDIRAKRIDVLLCLNIDRLGRSLMNGIALFRLLVQHEIELVSIDNTCDTSNLKFHLSVLVRGLDCPQPG